MPKNHAKTYTCPICHQEKPAREVLHGDLVHGGVLELIQNTHPGWSAQDLICLSCLNRLRAEYVGTVLAAERGELSRLEAEVVKSLKDQEMISQNINEEFESGNTFRMSVETSMPQPR